MLSYYSSAAAINKREMQAAWVMTPFVWLYYELSIDFHAKLRTASHPLSFPKQSLMHFFMAWHRTPSFSTGFLKGQPTGLFAPPHFSTLVFLLIPHIFFPFCCIQHHYVALQGPVHKVKILGRQVSAFVLCVVCHAFLYLILIMLSAGKPQCNIHLLPWRNSTLMFVYGHSASSAMNICWEFRKGRVYPIYILSLFQHA